MKKSGRGNYSRGATASWLIAAPHPAASILKPTTSTPPGPLMGLIWASLGGGSARGLSELGSTSERQQLALRRLESEYVGQLRPSSGGMSGPHLVGVHPPRIEEPRTNTLDLRGHRNQIWLLLPEKPRNLTIAAWALRLGFGWKSAPPAWREKAVLAMLLPGLLGCVTS